MGSRNCQRGGFKEWSEGWARKGGMGGFLVRAGGFDTYKGGV